MKKSVLLFAFVVLILAPAAFAQCRDCVYDPGAPHGESCQSVYNDAWNRCWMTFDNFCEFGGRICLYWNAPLSLSSQYSVSAVHVVDPAVRVADIPVAMTAPKTARLVTPKR